MAFKDNLRRFRERAGFTSKQMADKLDISYNTYLNYENLSSEPRYALLCKIARILKTSPNELLDFDPDHPDELTQAIELLKEGGVKFGDNPPKDCVSLFVHLPFLDALKKEDFPELFTDKGFTISNEDAINLYHNVKAELVRIDKENLSKVVETTISSYIFTYVIVKTSKENRHVEHAGKQE